MPPAVPPAKGTLNTNFKKDRDYKHHKDLINPKTNELIKG
jgi:hypothetical protein